MGLSSRTVEITVICGENVRVKEEACVVVRAESLKCCTTKMAKDNSDSGSQLCDKGNNGSSNFLSWNEKLLLDMPLHARSITFEVQNNNSKGVRPPAGVARIALSDVLGGGGIGGGDSLKVFSYRLRDWEGKRNGVIHFTITVVSPVPEECTVEPGKRVAEDEKKKNTSEVVLGAPLWWNYPNII